jgi:hypothetical protein
MNRSPRPSPRPQPEAPPPPPADVLSRTLAGLATRLSELMIKETALLISGRAGEIAVLQSEKSDLARAFAGRWAQLKADPTGAAALAPELTQALRTQIGRLAAVSAENEAAVRRVQNATNRVLGIIARAVRDYRQKTIGYNNMSARPRHAPSILGLALDRSL